MIKRSIPFARAKSIFEIDVAFFKKLGITTILSDLDNTLAPYDVDEPDEKCFELKKKLEKEGIALLIASNNTGKRVHHFADTLGVEGTYLLRKPFSGPLKKFLISKGLKPSEVLLIGDQVVTDVHAGNGAGIRTVLTDPIRKKEPIWTTFNRLFDNPMRRKIDKKGLSKPWKELL